LIRVTVVGKNSYLAGHFLDTEAGKRAVRLSHDEVSSIPLTATGCLINFAYPGVYMTDPYDPANDMDRLIAEHIKDTDIHFVLFSSRKVYDDEAPGPWEESSPLSGQNVNGENKIITEECVRRALEGRYTILRLPNIIEMAPGRHTFMGIALDTLKAEGRIRLDIHPATERDFLPLANFAAALEKVVETRPVGTYNLGSGRRTAVGDVAAWIIDGYGEGEIVSDGDERNDEFLLDVSRLETIIGPICAGDDIRDACVESGRRLRNG